MEIKGNNEMLFKIRELAFSSVYWSRKAFSYYAVDIYRYAPMIEGELWGRYFKSGNIVGVLEMEEALNRHIKVEELLVCPLSVNYLLWGNPIVTGSRLEKEKLKDFAYLVEKSIMKNERRVVRYELNRLRKIIEEH